MTFVMEWQCIDMPHLSPQFSDPIPPAFPLARRPALIPPNCSLSTAETADLIKTRTQQLPFPSPDAHLLKDIRSVSLATSEISLGDASIHTFNSGATTLRDASPTSDCDRSVDTATFPPALARRAVQRTAWLQARAQYARNRKLKYFMSCRGGKDVEDIHNERQRNKSCEHGGPKRKHSSFIQAEERKYELEAHAGTPHISNLQTDDDVSAQLQVEELSIGGEVAAVGTEGVLVGEAAVVDALTGIPDEDMMTR
ncbi:hypothetical protein CC80DRAFT_500298 [Byssothecium circinans]|uniref:Uncharacterized protein n=1 Tax=Byssothecium circinans TaxID=147558 RepID=A0A6A5UDD2_9PLEO|nr:hypothetical protein CC80DRAFT_500298 [Byssothecium circinans]